MKTVRNILFTEKPKEAKVEKPDILGRFFPQSPLTADDAQAIKKEQESFEKENKEKSEENEKSWRRMKMGYVAFFPALFILLLGKGTGI